MAGRSPGKTEADDVVAGELDAMFGFDGAAIDAADSLLAREVAGLERLGGRSPWRWPKLRCARRPPGSAPSAAATPSARRRCCRSRRRNRPPGSHVRRGIARPGDRGSCWCTRCGSADARSCARDRASRRHRPARTRARCSASSRQACARHRAVGSPAGGMSPARRRRRIFSHTSRCWTSDSGEVRPLTLMPPAGAARRDTARTSA